MSDVIRIPKEGDVIGGQFKLAGEIGRGGFGIVFKAHQLGIKRTVAVKMLMPHALTHKGIVERFKREARLASSIRHPNAVAIYAYGVHSENEDEFGLPYIAMEYLEGETLHQYMHRHGRVALRDSVSILKQALGSLAAAHRRGIIHRDLKPENIFIVEQPEQDRVIKVLDFGIAKAIDGDWDPETRERLTRTGMVTGTAEYMAPEQAQGIQDITPALDVYAMGCITFQLITGKVPYEGSSPMNIAIKHIAEPVPDLPPRYQDHFIGHVIRTAMAKEPQDRFTDAAAFLEILNEGTITINDQGETRSMAPVGPPVEIAPLPDSDRPPIAIDLGGEVSIPFDVGVVETEPHERATRLDMEVAAPPPPRENKRTGAWIAIGGAVILLLFAVTAAVIVISGDAPAPPDAALAATPSPPDGSAPPSDDSAKPGDEAGAPKADDAKADGDAKPTDGVAAAAGAAPEAGAADDAKDDAAPPGPELADAIALTSTPTAEIWREGEDKPIGETPIMFSRKDYGDAPLALQVRAAQHETADVVLDWAKPPKNNALSVELKRAKPTRKPGAMAARNNTAKDTPAKKAQPDAKKTAGATAANTKKASATPKGKSDGGAKKRTGPALFGAEPKKKTTPKKTPGLFQ